MSTSAGAACKETEEKTDFAGGLEVIISSIYTPLLLANFPITAEAKREELPHASFELFYEVSSSYSTLSRKP